MNCCIPEDYYLEKVGNIGYRKRRKNHRKNYYNCLPFSLYIENVN